MFENAIVATNVGGDATLEFMYGTDDIRSITLRTQWRDDKLKMWLDLDTFKNVDGAAVKATVEQHTFYEMQAHEQLELLRRLSI